MRTDRRTEVETDMTKVKAAIRNFAKTPKNNDNISAERNLAEGMLGRFGMWKGSECWEG